MFIGILANRKHALTGLFLVLAVALFLAVSSANSAYAEHEDFVGHEPPVCDILEFDGPLNGEISGNTASTVAKMQATFNQFGCRITGELEIVSRSFAGSGPFYGIVDGNALRFTVTSETSDAPRDLNFSGVIHGKIIKGQYSIPHTRLVGEWGLIVPEQKTVTQLTSLRDQASNFQLVAVIRELQARLSELRQERTELVADLEHQVRIESEDIIHRWDLAIEDLKAEVEHEIDLETRRIELEKIEVTRRLGRNTVVGELARELDIFIAEMWASFDEEAALKKDYMNDELDELEFAKSSKIERISSLIESVESDLQLKLKQSGLTLDQIRDQPKDPQTQVIQLQDQQSDVVLNIENDSPKIVAEADQPPAPSGNGEPTKNRGFFLNSESGALGDLGDSLDPTTLAVLGILITLAASGIQLVKGN